MGKRTIGIVGGYWSTNIGNSFFQLGAQYLLEKLFPDDQVFFLADQPGYWNTKRGNPANAFPILEHVNLDFLVILGPFLRPEYDRIWLNTLRMHHAQGTKIIMLAAGMMDYSDSAVAQCRAWLSETPPYIFTTRDSETYAGFSDLAEHSFNGIDVAFFVSDFFQPPKLELEPYLIANFDQIPEPNIHIVEDGKHFSQVGKPYSYLFHFRDKLWHVQFPKYRTALSRQVKVYPFLDAWFPQGYPVKIDDFLVVRTDHRFNPMLTRKTYKSPNSFVSDIPQPYLSLYANTELTLTNRVHACVASIAYGRHAMLFSDTPRARLLERVGLEHITERPMSISTETLGREKEALINFLIAVCQ